MAGSVYGYVKVSETEPLRKSKTAPSGSWKQISKVEHQNLSFLKILNNTNIKLIKEEVRIV